MILNLDILETTLLKTRDLKPFYDAMCLSSSAGYIYGDTDLILRETKNLKIKGRVTLDESAVNPRADRCFGTFMQFAWRTNSGKNISLFSNK